MLKGFFIPYHRHPYLNSQDSMKSNKVFFGCSGDRLMYFGSTIYYFEDHPSGWFSGDRITPHLFLPWNGHPGFGCTPPPRILGCSVGFARIKGDQISVL